MREESRWHTNRYTVLLLYTDHYYKSHSMQYCHSTVCVFDKYDLCLQGVSRCVDICIILRYMVGYTLYFLPKVHFTLEYNFTLSLNEHNLGNRSNAAFHFYADDTVTYCSSPSVVQTLEFLQSALDVKSHCRQIQRQTYPNSCYFQIHLTSNLPKISTAVGPPDLEQY